MFPGLDPLTFGSVLVLAGGLSDSMCRMPGRTEINVIPKSLDVQYDYTQSLDDIQGAATGTISPHSFEGLSLTQGFMKGAIRISQKVNLDYQTFPGHRAVCLWYDAIDITIEINPTIVIAKEVAEDRCMKRAVLRHEMKHVKVDREIINKYARTIGKTLYKELKDRGFKSGFVSPEHVQDMADRMQTTVYKLVEHEYKKMEIERVEEQRDIDSLHEYKQIADRCPSFMKAQSERYLNRK